MKVLTVTYRRVHNLGKYETETLEVQAEVEPGEDPSTAYQKLRLFVHDQLGIEPPLPIEATELY